MEQKLCKNKKCQRPLPTAYKHKYCENCRNKRVGQAKKIGTNVVTFGITAASIVVTVATKGNVKLKK